MLGGRGRGEGALISGDAGSSLVLLVSQEGTWGVGVGGDCL